MKLVLLLVLFMLSFKSMADLGIGSVRCVALAEVDREIFAIENFVINFKKADSVGYHRAFEKVRLISKEAFPTYQFIYIEVYIEKIKSSGPVTIQAKVMVKENLERLTIFESKGLNSVILKGYIDGSFVSVECEA